MGHTYEAYCLDEAVIFFGLSLENMLDEVANPKPSKEERRAKSAREALLKKVFSSDEEKKGTGFADPAAMMK